MKESKEIDKYREFLDRNMPGKFKSE